MGVLNKTWKSWPLAGVAVLITQLITPLPAAWAEIPSLFTGVEGSVNGSMGSGQIYSAGSSLQIKLGSTEDESNRSGDLHLNYTKDLSPTDPTADDSVLKQTGNWSGGFAIRLWSGATVGVDLDSLSDPTEFLSTEGAKLTLGQDPFRATYRHARNVINSPFAVPISAPPGTRTFLGAFIYQDTFEVDFDPSLGDSDELEFLVSYSLFKPDAPAFGDLLNQPAFTSIATFQDTLQSFEQWNTGITWRHQWDEKWDTSVSQKLAHLIIPASPLTDTTLTLGYWVNDQFHIQAGFDYIHDPLSHQATYQVELRFSWDRDEGDANEEDDE